MYGFIPSFPTKGHPVKSYWIIIGDPISDLFGLFCFTGDTEVVIMELIHNIALKIIGGIIVITVYYVIKYN